MNDLVSVIVPVYNVEPYVSQCLDSLLAQSYARLEIIVVDDGSTDKSGAICDVYAARDERIKVIHQANQGLSGARNTGIDAAIGEYICFVDSDDMVSDVFIHNLYQACKLTNANISICKFCRDEYELSTLLSGQELLDKRQSNIRLNQDSSGVYGVVWNKLFRRTLFKEIRFPVGRLHEDEFVVYRLLWNAGECVVLNDILYFYRPRQGSIVNSTFTEHRMDAAVAYQERIAFYAQQGAETEKVLAQACCCHFLRLHMCDIRQFRRDKVKYWKREMMLAYRAVMLSANVSCKKKLSLSIQMISPRMYTKIKGVVK